LLSDEYVHNYFPRLSCCLFSAVPEKYRLKVKKKVDEEAIFYRLAWTVVGYKAGFSVLRFS